jgi:hypothetical protein
MINHGFSIGIKTRTPGKEAFRIKRKREDFKLVYATAHTIHCLLVTTNRNHFMGSGTQNIERNCFASARN